MTGLKLRMCIKKLTSLFLNQNMYCGYSKEPSQRDGSGSFEHPKHKLKLMGKKVFTLKNFVYLNLYMIFQQLLDHVFQEVTEVTDEIKTQHHEIKHLR